jgi:decaprenylphospho-beta-D-ribofuranose 2-oxidase
VTVSTVPDAATLERLSGWGRTAPATGLVYKAIGPESVLTLMHTQNSSLVARGMGRSYGDAAQCSGGLTVDMSELSFIGEIDSAAGTVTVGAGVTLHTLLQRVIPEGWFVPVTPGTRYISVGGAIAADVHGKNHHRDGSFARHVVEMTLATPIGTHTVSPDQDPELFWATAGGMGLTGIVLSATLRLEMIETTWLRVWSKPVYQLDRLMSMMADTDEDHCYSVAWLDCAKPARGGIRSALSWADPCTVEDLPAALRSRRLEAPRAPSVTVRRPPPVRLVNRLSTPLLNEAWFRATTFKRERIQSACAYFHPLDAIAGWNVLYGRCGFVQYQFVVPDDRGDVVGQAVASIMDAGVPSFLSVLKRFGPGTPGPLSFPQAGWTLALDFPVGPRQLPALLDRLDDLIAEAGGRVYLAKDARLQPRHFEAMYPRADAFAAVRRRVDPRGQLTSDLDRRLGIPR